MSTTVAVELEAPHDFESFVDELAGALERNGLHLDLQGEGQVTQGAVQVGRVVALEPGRVLIEWRQADWAPDDRTELEIRADGDRIRVEHRGFGEQFWHPDDLVGWFADQVVAPVLAASAPARYGDWLTDRAARRPSGARQRTSYKDPSHHLPSFGAVLSALDLQPNDMLLELGCGGGAFLAQALRSGCRAVGLDHSREMIRAARELNAQAIDEGRLEVVEGDAHELPFEDNSFTCVSAMQVFFFFADARRVLTECHRVLRSAGRLAVFTVSEAAKGTPAAPEPMASRGHFYTDEELVQLARAAGFALASVGHPDLERYARAAGLQDDVVALFAGGASETSQLLLARR